MFLGYLAWFAMSPPPEKLTLPLVEQKAVAHSAEVRSAIDALRSAQARAGQVLARTRPQLSLAGSATRLDDKTRVSFMGVSMEMLGDHTEAVQAQLVQVLDLNRQLGDSYAQAKLAALAEEWLVRAKVSDQVLEARTAYLNVLRAAEGVKVSEATLAAYREQLRLANELYTQGVGQKIDLNRATSQVATAERDLLQRENDLNMARSVLNDMVGLPLASVSDLDDVVDQSGADGDEGERGIERALQARAEARGVALMAEAARKGIILAKNSDAPTFAVALTSTYYPTTSFSYPRQSVGALSFSINMPIFDGGQARAKAAEAAAAYDSAKAEEDRVRRGIALQVQNATLSLQTARKSRIAAAAALDAAKAARSLAGKRYEGQVGLYLEVTDAQAALSGAQAAFVNATYDVLLAEARLARALGDLGLPQEPNAPIHTKS